MTLEYLAPLAALRRAAPEGTLRVRIPTHGGGVLEPCVGLVESQLALLGGSGGARPREKVWVYGAAGTGKNRPPRSAAEGVSGVSSMHRDVFACLYFGDGM